MFGILLDLKTRQDGMPLQIGIQMIRDGMQILPARLGLFLPAVIRWEETVILMLT